MLCGRPPFQADCNLEIMRQIKIGEYEMKGKVWSNISKPVKELIRKMICIDPKKIISAI